MIIALRTQVGAFSVIVQPVVEPMDRFTALETTHLRGWCICCYFSWARPWLGEQSWKLSHLDLRRAGETAGGVLSKTKYQKIHQMKWNKIFKNGIMRFPRNKKQNVHSKSIVESINVIVFVKHSWYNAQCFLFFIYLKTCVDWGLPCCRCPPSCRCSWPRAAAAWMSCRRRAPGPRSAPSTCSQCRTGCRYSWPQPAPGGRSWILVWDIKINRIEKVI